MERTPNGKDEMELIRPWCAARGAQSLGHFVHANLNHIKCARQCALNMKAVCRRNATILIGNYLGTGAAHDFIGCDCLSANALTKHVAMYCNRCHIPTMPNVVPVIIIFGASIISKRPRQRKDEKKTTRFRYLSRFSAPQMVSLECRWAIAASQVLLKYGCVILCNIVVNIAASLVLAFSAVQSDW